ncbi:ABC transporter ATP-binding protein [Erysipelothrix sp. D19-032]
MVFHLKLKPEKHWELWGNRGVAKAKLRCQFSNCLRPIKKIHEGTITFEDKAISTMPEKELQQIRGNEISMIFQEPMTSLNPVFTVERQINEVLILHQGLSKKEASQKSLEMLEAVKIPNAKRILKSYPHQLSGGMSQRVMIAMALACNPKLLIADEPTTALDVIIQAEILKLMNDLKRDFKTSIMFITHDLGVISQMADDIIVMHGGKIVEAAPIARHSSINPRTRIRNA